MVTARSLRMLGPFLTALLVAAVPARAQDGWRRERLAVVVENLCGHADVVPVARLVAHRVFQAKGYEVPEGPDVARLLAPLALSAHGPLTDAQVQAVRRALQTDYVAVVTARFYLDPAARARGPAASAAMGVAVRIAGADGNVWTGSIGHIDEDATTRRPVPAEEVRRQVATAAFERLLMGAPRAQPDPALIALADEEARRAATAVARIAPPGPSMEQAIEKQRSFQGGPRFKLRIGRRLKGVQPKAIVGREAPDAGTPEPPAR